MNTMAGFFLVCFDCMKAQQEAGAAWTRRFMAQCTSRNLLLNAAHMVQRITDQPVDQQIFMPSRSMEDSIEMHFGRTKRMSQGSPSLKTVTLSTQRQHLLQRRRGVPPHKVRKFCAPSAEKIRETAEGALQSALAFEAACSVGVSVSELRGDFATWLQSSGERVIFNNFPVVAWWIHPIHSKRTRSHKSQVTF